ncbi:transcriptional regulator [Deinococcus cavernae]|uniref:transcriptional regulator n=1 Tax=Deinococcus cavernae TaxID=2320857 RepID=UPI0011C210DD|nr:transcriptional regulator [Deinococcus cavernae]
MNTDRAIELMGGFAYHVKIGTPPTVGGVTPSDRELKGAGKLYMPTGKKSLNAWRKLRGLEVLELGEVSGVGTTIGNFLYRGIVPKVDVAERLAAAVGVEVSQIEWGKIEQVDIANLPPMPKSPPFNPREGTPVISDEQMKIAVQWAEAGRSKKDVYEAMGVSHQTFYKVMQKYEEKHGPVHFKQTRVKKPSAQVQGQATQKAEKGPAEKGGKEKPSSRSRKAVKDVL